MLVPRHIKEFYFFNYNEPSLDNYVLVQVNLLSLFKKDTINLVGHITYFLTVS